MTPLSEKDIPEMLDLLSAWQSVHALLPHALWWDTTDLNQRTVALLNREVH